MFAPDWARSLGLFCSSLLLGGSFVFGTSLREMYESIILVTVMRPFDVGDRIEVNSSDLIVTRIRLLTTEAITSTNEFVILKNATLYNESSLKNLRRSPDATIEFEVFYNTASVSPQAMVHMDDWIKGYLSQHADAWHSGFLLSYVTMPHGLIQITERIQHRYRLRHKKPWQEKSTIRKDAAGFVYAFLEEVKTLGLDVTLPEQPVRLDAGRALPLGTSSTSS
mmetsp:Transcript_48393/g.113251  ORF Transcript_48393/g.113251 Transcript_48393/m.113251 type:complete len:223 (-) Transcript_48393:18-686(-)